MVAAVPFGIFAQYEYVPFSDRMPSQDFFDNGNHYNYNSNSPFSEHEYQHSSPQRQNSGTPFSTVCKGVLCPFCGSDYLDAGCICNFCGYDGSSMLSTGAPIGDSFLPLLIMALMFGTYLFIRNRLQVKSVIALNFRKLNL